MIEHGEEVVTEAGTERGYRLCLCSKCETVQRCVPVNDFYEDGDGLMCSGCFRKELAASGVPADNIAPEI